MEIKLTKTMDIQQKIRILYRLKYGYIYSIKINMDIQQKIRIYRKLIIFCNVKYCQTIVMITLSEKPPMSGKLLYIITKWNTLNARAT